MSPAQVRRVVLARNKSARASPRKRPVSKIPAGSNARRTRASKAATCGWRGCCAGTDPRIASGARTSRSEEHTSELQSLMRISYAVFCLKKKRQKKHKKASTKIYRQHTQNRQAQQQTK